MKPDPRNKKPVRKKSYQKGAGKRGAGEKGAGEKGAGKRGAGEKGAGKRRAPDPRVISEIVNRAAADAGLEVLEQKLNRDSRLRVILDRDEGALVVGQLVSVLKAIRKAMVARDLDPGEFQIEVDSPGSQRLLRTERHFERFKGHSVRVRLSQPEDGRDVLRMLLRGTRDGLPVLEDEQGTERILRAADYESIHLADG